MILKPKHQLGLGISLVGVAISLPPFTTVLHLNVWQGLLYLDLPCWIIAGIAGVVIGKALHAIRKERFDIEQAEFASMLDRHFTRMNALVNYEKEG